MRDLKNNLKPLITIALAAYTANQNGTGVDLRGFDGAAILFYGLSGDFASANETYQLKVQESDDNSAWNDVAADDLEGTLTLIDEVGDEGIQWVGYKGGKRYIRGQLVVAGTTPSLTLCAFVIKGKPHQAPVA